MLDSLKGKKILITGATGFIGSNLVHKCVSAQAEVFIFKRENSDIWRLKKSIGKITAYDVDLLDFKCVNDMVRLIKPEIIFHTATCGASLGQINSKYIIDTNFSATVNLVDACNSVGFEVFVNSGSSSEYGIKHKVMQETDVLKPLTDYGVSKAAGTLYCQALAKRENKSIVTLRLFSPYGYYEDKNRLIPFLILSCLKGVDPVLSSPNNVRDFVFIEDVLSAYILAVINKDRISGEIINIGAGKQYSIKEVVAVINEISKKKVSALWGGKDNPRVEPDFWQADIFLAEKLLLWKPKYDLFSGLKKSLDWFVINQLLY
ncbi:MAG: SDR family NAD(P)-dependent oxidoreductase [Candidatus Omnitrophica bacterium]|nr:SDR family NAD(P)-dependent oxidoreductase [Candidatus Omnitrophota bacterium]